VCDALATHEAGAREGPGIVLGACWAHAFSRFEESAPDHPEAARALAWIGALYEIVAASSTSRPARASSIARCAASPGSAYPIQTASMRPPSSPKSPRMASVCRPTRRSLRSSLLVSPSSMESFGLVAVRGEGGREVYAAAKDQPEANLLRLLVASKPSTAGPRGSEAERVRRRARALGAPLPVPPEPVPEAEREQAVVDAVRLARRDATFARVMPVMLWTLGDKVDRERLQATAIRGHEKHALGFLVALTAELAGDKALRAWSERLRDHRARGVRPFFALASARGAHALAEPRTPQVARDWGFSMDLDLDSFRTAFDKHMPVSDA
jgi:hypothetical protein